jgi:NAD/NADP transhydrogenase alpha subunit
MDGINFAWSSIYSAPSHPHALVREENIFMEMARTQVNIFFMEMAPAQVLARFSTFLASASVAAAYEVK